MNWIKITLDTVLPKNEDLLLLDGGIYFLAETVDGDLRVQELGRADIHNFTHYCIITEPVE